MKTQKTPKTKFPTPFELAQIAVALCRLRKEEHRGIYPDPRHHFEEAKRLIAEAKNYLDTNWKEHAANVIDGLFSRLPKNQTLSFDELLHPSGENSKGKKSLTDVATITTQNGLKKAIRRYFPKVEATRIIRDRHMTGDEVKTLLNAKQRAVEKRSAKRVKRASA